ncbi:uncharacterized protein DUF3160 [Archangium gephyra]|uniref:Uncharacterized protein DUF3160 n=1 Tax=Archangium gephyra TaxID=48 RepID=A0ABX9K6E6_9BACT|nr:DUF3160 domain-containing protein [Archangium gephyra]REG34144.1 uncharacterized protein DUF3160 [Archangium gephyra]
MNPRLALRVLLVPVLLLGCAGERAHLLDVPENTPKLEGKVLSAQAETVLGTQGLVISTHPHINSFHLGYTGLFKAHHPLYFTADSFLYAFHSSYDHILQDVERGALRGELGTLLTELRHGLAQHTGGSPEVRAEVDLFLTIAESILKGQPVAPVAGAAPQDVAHWFTTLQAEAYKGMQPWRLYELGLSTEEIEALQKPIPAAERLAAPWPLKSIAKMDLSMLQPRGHYTSDPELSRYFQAMMWLGRAEFRIAEWRKTSRTYELNPSALEAVVLLNELFTGRAEKAWTHLDETTRAFVGPADSLSFPGVRRALRAQGLPDVRGLLKLDAAELVKTLEPEANQRILSRLALKAEDGKQPIEFLVLGQRYVFDSEVLSAVSYGQLAQKRMMPSPLDVAWASFRNPAALPLLEPELTDYQYREALEAVATRGEQAGAELWQGSLYHLWLGALRGLSPDAARDTKLPALLRSEPWQRRMLNTQLASWAELRHDNLLYAKQSTSAIAVCEFPDAYVDPYPEFFRSFETLAERGKALVGRLEFPRAEDAQHLTAYFERLGEVAARLRSITEHEREGKALTEEELDFMNHAVSVDGKTAGCTRVWEAGGWYADLFYSREDVLEHEPIIADVHTQPTDGAGNPVGKVLHAATGYPRLMTVTLDLGKGPRTYQGFVSSYFEHTTRDFERLTDEEWRRRGWLEPTKGFPAEVPWLRDLLAR